MTCVALVGRMQHSIRLGMVAR